MKLSEYENNIINDKLFLKAKIKIIEKMQLHFEEVRKEIQNKITSSNFNFHKDIDITYGKIFKGENYLQLPYVVLDYPKLFSQDKIFNFRTMFWWGNFFSSTLHLDGIFLDKYYPFILNNYNKFQKRKVFFSISDSPWDYHFNRSNYILFNKNNLVRFTKRDFVKISCKFELNKYDELPNLVSEYFSFLLSVLSNEM